MLRLLLGLVAGIYFGRYALPDPCYVRLLLGLLWIGIVLMPRRKCSLTFIALTSGSSICLLFFIFGIFVFQTDNKPPAKHWTTYSQGSYVGTARILKRIPRATHTQLIIAVNTRLDSARSLHSVSGKALLLIPRKDGQAIPETGSLIGFRTTFRPIKKAMNPMAFDPAAYWKKQLINQEAWMEAEQLIFLQPGGKGSIVFFRNRALAILEKLLPGKEQLGIAVALVLGDKSLLDSKVKSSYSESGAIHVLAVSGLHVGLVYGMCYWMVDKISLLLPFLRRLKLGVLLLSLVGYAAFTGASPSVCRAVIMLSCWIIGKALHKSPSVYNVISVSAFVLLLFDPLLLFDLGFQLSYSAVLGIISLYPLIVKCWTPRLMIIEYGWKLIGVSMAAQLGTLPWTLYYFHQFPTYFGFSSLLIIPLITVILVLAFFVLFFSWHPLISGSLAKVLQLLIDASNEVSLFIQHLPFALIEDIWINKMDIVFYFMFVWGMFQLLRQVSYPLLGFLLGLSMIWGTSYLLRIHKDQKASSFVVYHLRDHFLTDWFEKGRRFTLMEPGVDSLQLRYASKPWRSYKGAIAGEAIKLPVQFLNSDTAMCWMLNKEQALLLGPSSRFLPKNSDPDLKKILIVDPANRWPEYWTRLENIQMVVLIPRANDDGKWKQGSEDRGVPLWPINEKGAFIYDY